MAGFADLDIIGYAYVIVGGLIPALLWLWFWLKEDNVNPEPGGLLFITFILGAMAVPVVIPIQQLLAGLLSTNDFLGITAAAGAEELVKFLAVALVAFGTKKLDEPIDYPIYLITAAMGFAALENSFFLVDPILLHDTTISFLTGNLRFLGSTLLHSATAATLGISIGLAMWKPWPVRAIYFVVGICAATALHSVFNFFIISRAEGGILQVYAFLWVVTIIIMLVFEKLRRMSMYGPD